MIWWWLMIFDVILWYIPDDVVDIGNAVTLIYSLLIFYFFLIWWRYSYSRGCSVVLWHWHDYYSIILFIILLTIEVTNDIDDIHSVLFSIVTWNYSIILILNIDGIIIQYWYYCVIRTVFPFIPTLMTQWHYSGIVLHWNSFRYSVDDIVKYSLLKLVIHYCDDCWSGYSYDWWYDTLYYWHYSVLNWWLLLTYLLLFIDDYSDWWHYYCY